MATRLKSAAAALGSRGGKAGAEAAKRRGDSAYYRLLAARRRDRRTPGSGMDHRHLAHHDYTLAAIDDIIASGGWETWQRLRLAVRSDPGVLGKVVKVCAANRDDPPSQRHRFWSQYAESAAKPA
jgi:hypothetical protein